MIEVTVKDAVLKEAAQKGMDDFLQVIIDAIYNAIGGELTADTLQELNSDQITLLAYVILRDTVMDGGFVELIHNGYGHSSISIHLQRLYETGDYATSTRLSVNLTAFSENTGLR